MSEFERDLLAMIFHLKNNRPALFLSVNSVTVLSHFIGEFMCGYSFPKIHSSVHFLHGGFQEFLENKYIGHESAKGRHLILLEQCGNDEEKALYLFFDELEVFLIENNIKIPMELPPITLA